MLTAPGHKVQVTSERRADLAFYRGKRNYWTPPPCTTPAYQRVPCSTPATTLIKACPLGAILVVMFRWFAILFLDYSAFNFWRCEKKFKLKLRSFMSFTTGRGMSFFLLWVFSTNIEDTTLWSDMTWESSELLHTECRKKSRSFIPKMIVKWTLKVHTQKKKTKTKWEKGSVDVAYTSIHRVLENCRLRRVNRLARSAWEHEALLLLADWAGRVTTH